MQRLLLLYILRKNVSEQPRKQYMAPVDPNQRASVLPPLLSSVPLLPVDSLGEEEGSMEIFNR